MKWEPIETAPKDGTPILVTNGIGVFDAYWERRGAITQTDSPGWVDGETDKYEDLVVFHTLTHWMPLPSPPQAQSQIEEPGTGDDVSAEDKSASLTLIKRLVQKLQSVSRDTHYGIHDGDYYVPYGEKPADWQTEPCGCALCSGLKLLAENEVANDT